MSLLQSNVSLASNPIDINLRRSKFKRVKKTSDTFNVGELIPIYLDQDVMPGETVTMNMSEIVRLQNPIHPTMDDLVMDIAFFAVPQRLLWTHFKEFKGENSNSVWTTPVEYEVPQIEAPSGGWDYMSVADHFGIPPKVSGFSVSALPFRAYALCFNEWWRSESITQPVSIELGDATVTGTNGTWSNYVTEGSLGGSPLKVSRLHDAFSSGLMQPQAGEPVEIPFDGYAHVYPNGAGFGVSGLKFINETARAATPILWAKQSGSTANPWTQLAQSDKRAVLASGSSPSTERGNTASTGSGDALIPYNLVADLHTSQLGITVDSLRSAFAIQRVLERVNRGSRYIEIIKNCFGTTSLDARHQRPELLCIKRVPINIAEINQTSSTDATSPLGTPGASSKTLDTNLGMFTYSATEHCMILGLACVRVNKRTYSDGLDVFWTKKRKFDFYWPDLANLSDSAIPNSAIYLQPNNVVDSDGNVVNELPFAYQEAWWEYRNSVNEVKGLFRPSHPQTLASWNYADHYTSLPTLSTDWLVEDSSVVARTLAVTNQPQLLANFYFEPTIVAPMPLYSIPGMDTHF